MALYKSRHSVNGKGLQLRENVVFGICYRVPMKDAPWFHRLIAELEKAKAAGRRPSTISKAAGLGPNYVREMMAYKNKQGPSVDVLIKLCEQLQVSLTYILLGVEMAPEDEKLLEFSASLDSDHKLKLLDFLQSLPGTHPRA